MVSNRETGTLGRRTVRAVDWFANVALDGIVGAVLGATVGGAVAGWALQRTIRHEREQRADAAAAAEADEMRRDVQAFRRRIAEVYAELERGLVAGAQSPQSDLKRAVGVMRTELILLELEARRLGSDLEHEFAELRAKVGQLSAFAGGFVGREVFAVQEFVVDELVRILDESTDW